MEVLAAKKKKKLSTSSAGFLKKGTSDTKFIYI